MPATYRVSGGGLFVLLTVLYLLAEFSFNARLLDVAGGSSTDAEVEALEFWGKSLSGVAATLLIGRLLSHRLRLHALAALIVASPAIPAVYWGQGALIDHLVERSSNQERQIATYVTLVPTALINRIADLEHYNLTEQEFASPAAKTFFALFPALAYSSPSVIRSIDRQLEELLRSKVERSLGDAHGFHNKVFLNAINETKRIYNKSYVPASEKAVSSADTKAHWDEYRANLAKAGIDPYVVKENDRRRVVHHLQKKDLPVPDDFQLNDRAAFDQAILKKHSKSGARSFSAEASKELGFDTTMGPGLNWVAFAAHPDIQRKVTTELRKSIPDGSFPKFINLNWSPAEVERQFYRPLVASLTTQALGQFRAAEKSYARGAVNGDRAEKAVRATLVPPIALFFSLFFSVFNVLGLAVDGAARLSGGEPNVWLMNGLRAALLAAIVVVPMQFTNPVVESGAFKTLVKKIDEQGKTPLSLYLTWVVKAEPVFYPVADAIRRNILLGFDFSKNPFKSGAPRHSA
jgi:hypothetical protein